MEEEIIEVAESRNEFIESFSGCDAVTSGTEVELSTDSATVFPEADESALLGLKVESEKKAYELYNEYAYLVGFSTRFHNRRHCYSTNKVKAREIVCAKQGFKKNPGIVDKKYTKLDVRTGCKAKVTFEINEDWEWEVVKHELIHNHSFCPRDKVHLLQSHRIVDEKHLKLLEQYVEAGIGVVKAFRFLRNQAAGSPALGFTTRDAHNHLAKAKRNYFDGCDSQALIDIFTKRRETEEDFFFDYELDEESRLISFFWRDKRMKEDYIRFGKLLIHDDTYRTNKYKMICAPFVGMNHHGKNCMFGCGFVLNERTESFVWLFSKFLESMDGLHPETMMTDQAFSMGAAIKQVFPDTKHKLCTWHILQNSRSNIPALRSQEGFQVLFNQTLMYCDSVAEFEHFWNRLVTEFNCGDHPWLIKLYSTREKWCPAFTKDRFSGGVLSSQRSESTNRSVSKDLHKLTSLVQFYKCFCRVLQEWRKKERDEDTRCWQGFPEIAVPNCDLLKYACKIYTIQGFYIFQENYLNGVSCKSKPHNSGSDGVVEFVVWMKELELFGHVVSYIPQTNAISCTCKRFDKVGILCCHCLRVYLIMCVGEIPQRYILKRWTREFVRKQNNDGDSSGTRNCAESETTWIMTQQRQIYSILHASASNMEARLCVENGIQKMKNDVDVLLRDSEAPEFFESTSMNSRTTRNEEGTTSAAAGKRKTTIRNPERARTPGARNKRRKSTREKISNRCRTRKRVMEDYDPSESSPVFVNRSSNNNVVYF